MTKKILLGLLVILIGIQFIRPTRNISADAGPNDIALHYTVPADVHAVLKHSCYDCHSNNSAYPFYMNIQPVGWWMQWHIDDGKRHLNFSEFGSYTEKRAKHKFEEIEEAARDGWMPLASYTFMHEGTKLSPEDAKKMAAWAGGLK